MGLTIRQSRSSVRAELEKNWHAREAISGLRHPAKLNACSERKPNGIPG
jgi:hypothetical protein